MTFNTLDKRMAMSRIPQTDYATMTSAAANKFVEEIGRARLRLVENRPEGHE